LLDDGLVGGDKRHCGLVCRDGRVGGSTLSVVLLGANAVSGRTSLLRGNIPVPRNPAWAFSTVAAFAQALLNTGKNSILNSFCPAIILLLFLPSWSQWCFRLLKRALSAGCSAWVVWEG
jgi:hypothetical protein